MDFPPPLDAHRWLSRFTGNWLLQSEEGGMASHGTEVGEMLGERWLYLRGQATWEGGGHEYVFLLGYEPDRERYVGSFASSIMDRHWVYEGQVEGDTLVLDTTGPGVDGKEARMRDHMRVDGDSKVLYSTTLGEDGTWTEFMRMIHTRQG